MPLMCSSVDWTRLRKDSELEDMPIEIPNTQMCVCSYERSQLCFL